MGQELKDCIKEELKEKSTIKIVVPRISKNSIKNIQEELNCSIDFVRVSKNNICVYRINKNKQKASIIEKTEDRDYEREYRRNLKKYYR